MKNKIIITSAIFASLFLSACETASQRALNATSSSTSSSSTSKSLFAQAKQTAADKLIAVGDRVLFDYDSAKLDSSAKILLDSQSRFLRANTDLNFVVEGHCDERGTREYNLALGEKRATAVIHVRQLDNRCTYVRRAIRQAKEILQQMYRIQHLSKV